MSFVGKLDQFKLPDLLQIVSATGKTGRLSLTRRDSQGVIVFRRGKIIYAASSSARQTLGSLLLCQQLIDDAQLARALEIQHQATVEQRLGSILIEIGAIDKQTLEAVITHQIEEVVTEFMQWDTGFFKFDLIELADQGEIEVDAADFLHTDGLSTQQVLLDITTRLDELEESQRREAAGEDEEEAAADGAPLESLRSIMSEIRSPQFTGEATGKILGYAREALPRGALFVIRRNGFRGMSRFGPDVAGDEKLAARRLRLPLEQPSVLAEAADSQNGWRGPLADTAANRLLLEQLGGDEPTEAIAIPLVVNDNVLLVLYGDNAPDGAPIEGFHQLELLMLQAGLAMERNLLKKRLQVLEKRLQR